ncbi:hypothetical protein E4T56_gene845 [Termitomyces sp. T112]|nr:hypothetical protein E4T56_gene845 [Termitomyces sp. T112]
MALTGARVGEACGMLWDVVDLEAKQARVVRSVSWDHWTRRPTLQESTKTESSVRTLNLPDELVELLKEMHAEAKGAGAVRPTTPALRHSAFLGDPPTSAGTPTQRLRTWPRAI